MDNINDDLAQLESDASGTSSIKSVIVSWRILETIAAAGLPVRLSDIAERLALPKARVHRHLKTLKEVGVVFQAGGSERYWLGARIAGIGQAASRHFDIARLAEAHLQRLRDEVHCTVLLSVPMEGRAEVVSVFESDALISVTVRKGAHLPPHASAQGRIALAYADPATRRAMLARPLKAMTGRTPVDPGELELRCEAIRENLVEYSSGEAMIGISALAAPILDHDDRLVGIVSLLGAEEQVSETVEFVRAVQECAAAASFELGSTAYVALGFTPR